MKNMKKHLALGLATLLLLHIVTGLYLGYTNPEEDIRERLYDELYSTIESADIPDDLKESLLDKIDASYKLYIKGNVKASEKILESMYSQIQGLTVAHDYNDLWKCLRVIRLIQQLGDGIINVTIGVTVPNDDNIESTEIITAAALEDINEYCDGSLYRFDYILLSNEANAQTALDNTIWFNEHGINLVAGHGWSSQCDSSLDYVNDNDMLLFSSSSTYTALKYDDNLYRLTPDDSVQGNILVELYAQMGIHYVYIYYEDDGVVSYGESIKSAIEAQCGEGEYADIEVVDAKSYNPNDWDIYSDMMEIEDSLASLEVPFEQIGFQVISINGIDNILSEAEWSDVPIIEQVTWFCTDQSCKSQEVVEDHPYISSKVKVYGTLPSPEYGSLEYEALASRLPDPWFYACTRYDLLWVYALSVIQADSTQTDAVKTAMQDIVDGYTGASGTSTFDEYGDRMLSDYEIWGYGWNEDSEPSFIQYGEYDQETYTLELYDDVTETPPEIALYYPTFWPYTKYYVDDPGSIWYELLSWISVYSKDGVDDIVSMTLTDPNDEVYDMWDDGPWGFQPDTTRYMNIIEPDESSPGTYTFTAIDSDDNPESLVVTIPPWFSTLFESVSPYPGDWFTTDDEITWSWTWPGDEQPEEVDHYLVILTNEQGFEWCSEDQYDFITYDGDPLEDGRYNYELYAMSEEPGGEVVAYGYIYIGEGLVLYEPWIDSFTNVNAETSEETYSMLAAVKVASSGGLEDLEYVKLILPDETEIELVESEENGGWYEVVFDVDDRISGDFIFESYDGDTPKQIPTYYDGWVTESYTYLSPELDEYVDAESLVFDWSIDITADDYYQEVTLWGPDDPDTPLWSKEGEPSIPYDGESLEPGYYRYEVLIVTYTEGAGEGLLIIENWFYIY